MPAKILVVDDEPDLELLIRQRFRKPIQEERYDFHFAANGVEALRAIHDDDGISVVLTDLNMPEMDGLTLLSHLAQIDRLHKAVVISAYGDMENIRTAMNRGAFDFLTKPIDFRDLEITVQRTLEELDRLSESRIVRQKLLSVQQELEVAARIQASILPKRFPAFPDRSDIDLFAAMKPAKEVGGDFYDFFLIDPHRLGFVIGDVAGKGVPAAIFMAVTRSLLKAIALSGADCAEAVRHVNELLYADNTAGLFVTLFYGILDTRSGDVAYTNAGHNPPYILRENGGIEQMENQGGIVLGVIEGAKYNAGSLRLAPGEGLFLYTDGVTEAMNPARQFYSTERLEERLRAAAVIPPDALTTGIFADVDRFSSGYPQHDDITALALRYFGSRG